MSIKVQQQKFNTNNQNMNFVNQNDMVGDISYEELLKIDGISTIALAVKKKASYSHIVFKKGDHSCSLSALDIKSITYRNVKLLKKYTSSKGKISSTRMTGVKNKQKQRKLRLAIMHARYLGLLPYVLY